MLFSTAKDSYKQQQQQKQTTVLHDVRVSVFSNVTFKKYTS